MVEKTNSFSYHPDDQTSQLEVLRNILMGDIVAHYEHRLNDLEAQLLKTENKFEKKLKELDANLEKQSLTVDKQFENQKENQNQKLTEVHKALSTEINTMQKIVLEKVSQFENQNEVAKKDLASLFIKLGEQLKDKKK